MLDRNEAGPRLDIEERERSLAVARVSIGYAQWLVARVLRLEDTTCRTIARSVELTDAANFLKTELQAAIADHARLMRQSGEPPELAIVLVKEIADAASRQVFREKRLLDWTRVAALRWDVARWTVAAYYDLAS